MAVKGPQNVKGEDVSNRQSSTEHGFKLEIRKAKQQTADLGDWSPLERS